MSLVHDFDEVVNRRGTDSKKYSVYPEDVIPMWIADSDFKAPQPVVDALVARMQQGVYGYTPISERLKKAGAGWQKKRFGWDVDPEWVEFVPGVITGLICAVRALSQPGDNIVIQSPCYPPFSDLSDHNGRHLLRNKLVLTGDHYEIDFEDFEEKCKDPRTKLFGTLVYIVSLFIADNLWAYLAATIFLIAAIKLSNVPVKFMVRGLKSIMFLLLLSVSFNLFLTPGTPIFKIGFLQMTWEGLRFAAFMAIRLVYLVMGSTILTLTTTPNQLTDGLEKSLGFLKKVGVPVHEVSMMMSIALRFIPILIEETDKIMKAQMARGADFESGNLIQKAKSMVPLLVPLFVSAFRRATDLAMAMEARCYRGGEGRTKMKPLKYAKRDHMVYGAYLVYFAAAIVLKVLL